MNKRIQLYLIEKFLNLYLNKQLTEENCQKVLDEKPFLALDDDMICYEETALLCKLFNCFPYYSLKQDLKEFSQALKNIHYHEKTTLSFILPITAAYLEDFYFTIEQRIKTELDHHIYHYIKLYSFIGEIDSNIIKKTILHNMSKPETFFSLNTAENALYNQEVIFDNDEDVEELREKVSKNNYFKKTNTEGFLVKAMAKNLNEEEFSLFEERILNEIQSIKSNSNKELEILYKNRFCELRKLCKSIWNKQQNKEEELILLFLKKENA